MEILDAVALIVITGRALLDSDVTLLSCDTDRFRIFTFLWCGRMMAMARRFCGIWPPLTLRIRVIPNRLIIFPDETVSFTSQPKITKWCVFWWSPFMVTNVEKIWMNNNARDVTGAFRCYIFIRIRARICFSSVRTKPLLSRREIYSFIYFIFILFFFWGGRGIWLQRHPKTKEKTAKRSLKFNELSSTEKKTAHAAESKTCSCGR